MKDQLENCQLLCLHALHCCENSMDARDRVREFWLTCSCHPLCLYDKKCCWMNVTFLYNIRFLLQSHLNLSLLKCMDGWNNVFLHCGKWSWCILLSCVWTVITLVRNLLDAECFILISPVSSFNLAYFSCHCCLHLSSLWIGCFYWPWPKAG